MKRRRFLIAALMPIALLWSVSASAAVAQLDTWALAGSANPGGGNFSVAAGNITVAAGTNRLLIVAASFESNAGGALTNFDATLGGTPLTAIASSATNQRNVTKIWYLLESSIPGGAAALNVSGNYNQNLSGIHVYWASFSGVDQTTPINSSNANYNAATNVTFGAAVNFVAGGLTFFSANNGGTGSAMTPPAGFTTRLATNQVGLGSSAADAGVHGAAGSFAAGTQVNFSGTVTRSAVAVASLTPAATGADVSITKTATSPIYLGDTFTYTLNVTNGGPNTATNVSVTDSLPAEVEYVFVSTTQGTCTPGAPLTCSLGSLANGATAIVTIFVKAKVLGAVSNTGSVTATEADADLTNNSSTVMGTILQINTADVSITKTALPASVAVGGNVTYTLSAQNNGPDTANAVTVTDNLPVGMTWVSTVTTLGACSGTNVVSCNLGNMANGATATITIVATANSAGTKLNQAGTGIDTSTTYDPIPTNDSATATHTVTGGPPTLPLVCSTPGGIGPGGTLSGVINAYYPGTASVAAGATAITIGAARALPGAQIPIAIGDLLMVIQMQDATINSSNTNNYGGNNGTGAGALVVNAGAYEFVRATSAVALGGGTLNLQGAGAGNGLINAYTNTNASGTKGQARFQVVRVPQYTTATLNGVTAAPWLTTTTAPIGLGTGGILAIDVQGVLTINSGVAASVDAVGFRGGAGRQLGGGAGANTDWRTLSTNNANGSKGEGNAGTPAWVNTSTGPLATNQPNDGYPNGSMARGAPGNAGGGSTDGNPAANDQNSGGGGGSNGGAGGTGGFSWATALNTGGVGAAVTPAITKLVLGGGGGAGTRNNSPGLPLASGGSTGGGLMVIRAGELSIGAGAILSADGANAYNGTENDGGGGGGAGGSVIVTATTGTMNGLSIRARGGRGGDAWATQAPGGSPGARHGPGGGGGGGVVVYTNTATPPTLDVTGGQPGITTTANDTFGAQAGAIGQTLFAAPGLIPGVGSASDCAIDLTIALTHSPATVAPGDNVPFVANVTNLGPFNSTTGLVSVTITIDAGLSFNGLASGTGWSCAAPVGQSVTCTRSDALAAQTSFPSITFNATVTAAGPATLSGNSATVTNAGDSNNLNNTDTDIVGVKAPTLARTRSFEAIRTGEVVYLTWTTSFESDNLGFHVYRESGGTRHVLTPAPIAGSAFTVRSGEMASGRSYTWIDRRPVEGTDVFYWLEDIDIDTSRRWSGPAIPHRDDSFDERVGLSLSSSPSIDGLGHEASSGSAAEAPRGVGFDKRADLMAASEGANDERRRFPNVSMLPAAKILVEHDGWYRVTRAELIAAGFDPGTKPQKLQLIADGLEQAILVNDGGDGIFDPSDSIEFYGLVLDSPYETARVYWLIERKARTLVDNIQLDALPPAPTSFPFTLERKDRTVFFSALTNNGDAENIFGPVITTAPETQDLDLQHFDASVGGSSELEVALQGGTVEILHVVEIQVNGSYVGTVEFSDHERVVETFDVPNTLVHAGANQLTMVATGGADDVSVIDYVRLTYPHLYELDSGALRMNAPSGTHVTIEGLSDTTLRDVDESDPLTPTEIKVEFASQGPLFSGSFGVPGDDTATLFAFDATRVSSPADIVANTRSYLRSRLNRADLIVLANPSLLASFEPLAEARTAQGLRTKVVDVTDVYDEFSAGHKTPYAIRDFMTYARENWRVKPRFVLLGGDASFDPKGYLGLGKFDLVPTKLVATEYMKTASDDWLVDANNDGFPEIAIGRLPARTPAEAVIMVDKILAREEALSESPAWATHSLLVAGKNDEFDFETATTGLEAYLPSDVSADSVFEGTLGGSTRSTIVSHLNAGQLLVNYSGHGSVAVWSKSGIFGAADVAALSNGDKLPLVISMTCLNGYFQDIYTQSLAESFLKAPNGGAVAVWTSSALTEPVPQMLMNQEFLRLIFQGSSLTVGEAVVGAKAVVSDEDVRRSWILFGDPSMRLR